MGRGFTLLPKKGLTAAQTEALITGGDTEIDAHIQAVADARIAASMLGWTPGAWFAVKSPVAVSGVSVAANTLYAGALLVPDDGHIDRIGVNITTASGTPGTKARLGLYGIAANGYAPGPILHDAGEIATDALGVVSITVDWERFSGQLICPTILSDSVISISGYATMLLGDLGLTDPSTNPRGRWNAAQAYGPLPETFPGAPVFSSTLPRVAVRAAV
jgi:hypothetical protein